jgi:hypothetical protein
VDVCKSAGDPEAIKILKSTFPVAWLNINLIGDSDFTTSSSPGRHRRPGGALSKRNFWRRAMTERDDDGPQE